MTIRSLVRSPIRSGIRSLIGGDVPVIIDGTWLMATGYWDNTGVWDNAAIWINEV